MTFQWIEMYQQRVEFENNDFLKTVDLLINQPEYFSPFIKRAEILSDNTTGSTRTVEKKIVQKSKLDKDYVQHMSITNENSITVVSWLEIPIDEYPFTYPKIDRFRISLDVGILSIELVENEYHVGLSSTAKLKKVCKITGRHRILIIAYTNSRFSKRSLI